MNIKMEQVLRTLPDGDGIGFHVAGLSGLIIKSSKRLPTYMSLSGQDYILRGIMKGGLHIYDNQIEQAETDSKFLH